MLPLRFFADRRYSAAIASLALVLFALLGSSSCSPSTCSSPSASSAEDGPGDRARSPRSCSWPPRLGPRGPTDRHQAGGRRGPAPDRPRARAPVAHLVTSLQRRLPVLRAHRCSASAWPSPRPPSRSSARSRRRRPGGFRLQRHLHAGRRRPRRGGARHRAQPPLQDVMTPLLAHQHVPARSTSSSRDPSGGALAVAQRLPAAYGDPLAEAAQHGFVSGMDLGFAPGRGGEWPWPPSPPCSSFRTVPRRCRRRRVRPGRGAPPPPSSAVTPHHGWSTRSGATRR